MKPKTGIVTIITVALLVLILVAAVAGPVGASSGIATADSVYIIGQPGSDAVIRLTAALTAALQDATGVVVPVDDPSISSETDRVAQWVTSPLSGPVPGAPVANFGVIENGILYRSSQPDDAGYRWLLQHGIKSIVSFQREAGDEHAYITKQGFTNYLWLNIEDLTNPNDEQAKQFLDFVTNPGNWPILIHCRAGMGRTGTLAALVRYSVDGWSLSEAMEEAKLYTGGAELTDSQIAWLQQWAEKHPAGSYQPLPPARAAHPGA